MNDALNLLARERLVPTEGTGVVLRRDLDANVNKGAMGHWKDVETATKQLMMQQKVLQQYLASLM